MAVTKLLLSSLLVLFLLPFLLSVALPSHSVPGAVKTLWDSGLTAMSLLMEYGGERVMPNTKYPSLTVFAPSDAVFEQYGQPSLDQLHLHFSPMRLSPETRRSLRAGMKIPTLAEIQLVVSSSSPSDGTLALNGVNITDGSPVYDDGSMMIFMVGGFFDPDFQIVDPNLVNISCTAPTKGGFAIAAEDLRSKGYSVMASFLDMQVGKVGDGELLTVFAPVDEWLIDFVLRVEEHASLFLSHISPCKITWRELADLDEGSQLQTYMEGFKINVTKSGDDLRLNGVLVIERGVFSSNWLVVHGIGGALVPWHEKNETPLPEFSGNQGKFRGDFIEFLGFSVSIALVSVYLFGLR